MFKINNILTLVACLLPSLSLAQDNVTLQFLSFPKAANPEPLELVIGEGKTITVDVPTNSISKNYKVPLLSSWVLGKTIENKDGEPTFQVLGKTQSISKDKQLILVIRDGSTNENGLKLIAMPNDESKIGGGTFFFLNAAPDYEIAGKVTDSKFSIKLGHSAVIKPKASKVTGDYKYCEAVLVYRKGESFRTFYTQTWRLHDSIRNFIFIYQDPITRKIKLHVIEDVITK